MQQVTLRADFAPVLLPFPSALAISCLVPLRLSGDHAVKMLCGDARSYHEGAQGTLNGIYGSVNLVTEHLGYLSRHNTTLVVLRATSEYRFDQESVVMLQEMLAHLDDNASKLVPIFADHLAAIGQGGIHTDIVSSVSFEPSETQMKRFYEAAHGEDRFGTSFWYKIFG